MKNIILASNNQGKVKDFECLNQGRFNLLSQSKLNISAVPEDGLSFVENALIKARNATKQGGLPAIADDSGIVVDYLGGKPGIYSARYAGKDCNSQKNNEKLLSQLINVPFEKRTAHFWCTMVFIEYELDPTPLITQGVWQGFIASQAIGDNGFGYDPIFYVPTHQCTAAQLDINIKNSISHRAMAVTKLMKKLKNY